VQHILTHRSRQEELARHVEDLVPDVHKEQEACGRPESDLNKADKEYDSELRRERQSMEAKESALPSALNDLAWTQSFLMQREGDLAAVQFSLQGVESESKRLGETHTTARFSLQLEADRLKRNLERLEDELTQARKDLDDREAKNGDRDTNIDKFHTENHDLPSQLAMQTQTRLNVLDKLDGVQGNLRAAESELATFKARVNELEQQLSKVRRSLLSASPQY
jgi:chromosome segregation ATPase